MQCFLLPDKANRHGLITGATGTGKTITLQSLAEGFSALGVPVFMADVKGDLTGIAKPAASTDKLASASEGARLGRARLRRLPHHAVGRVWRNRATRCAPPSATWARCCWAAC